MRTKDRRAGDASAGGGAPLVVVSGLPRSGTSLLMQMLAAGGHATLTDRARAADEHNPRGYWEYSPVKTIEQEHGWLEDARGRAVKIVVPLVRVLAEVDWPAKVLLVLRPLDEVLASQRAMLPGHDAPADEAALRESLAAALDQTLASLQRAPQIDLLTLRHRALFADPKSEAERVAQFLGRSLDTAAMAAALDPGLHRNRIGGGGWPAP